VAVPLGLPADDSLAGGGGGGLEDALPGSGLINHVWRSSACPDTWLNDPTMALPAVVGSISGAGFETVVFWPPPVDPRY
jgi:hypothetical protein